MAIEKKTYVDELKAKKNAELEQTGKMTFTAADLAPNASESVVKEDEGAALSKSMSEASVVPMEEVKLDDALLQKSEDSMNNVMVEEIDKSITITPDMKHRFIDSVISNDRYVLPFTIFNGVKVVVRSRTQKEAEGCYKLIGSKALTGDIKTQADYVNLVRRVLIAVQLESFNGKDYESLDLESDEFMERLKAMDNMGVGVITAIYQRLVEFESIYWIMVDSSSDANFWSPVESS